MKARDVAVELALSMYRRSVVMPSITPRNWYECDLLEITKAGYFREFEVKLTKADFVKDACKASWKDRRAERTKHTRLDCRDTQGPCEFTFVVPEDLAPKLEPPAWAGMMAFKVVTDIGRPRVYFRSLKTALRLHRTKADPALRMQVFEACYWRYLPSIRKVT